MSQHPTLELADVLRRFAPDYERHRDQPLPTEQRRVLRDLVTCRTAALGGHQQECDHCGHRLIAYNSCRNRHCPKCCGSAAARWVDAREQEVLAVPYFHVVFTLPASLNGLALANRRTVYNLLFQAVSRTLLQIAADPKHLGASIGFLAVLHTWGQTLTLHPHIHCIVPGGGLSPDGRRWIACRPDFFLPVRVLSRVFRGKFLALLRRAHKNGSLTWEDGDFSDILDLAATSPWVVYAKPPFGGPGQLLRYLARYTHKIAISNHRLLGMDDSSVTFRWKDYADHQRQKTMTLAGEEFVRRFLMHVVPHGFARIRSYGLLANRHRSENVARCRSLIEPAKPSVDDETIAHENPLVATDTFRTAPADVCPRCGIGHLHVTDVITPPKKPTWSTCAAPRSKVFAYDSS